MRSLLAPFLILLAGPAWPDPPVIEHTRVAGGAQGWRFDVTLLHPDTGWDHYADGWRVLDMAGNTLGMRELLHPHVGEQPFTRSLGGVTVPAGADHVRIEARCSVDGWSADAVTVPLH